MRYKRWLQDEADTLDEMGFQYVEETGEWVHPDSHHIVYKMLDKKTKTATYEWYPEHRGCTESFSTFAELIEKIC